MFCQNCGKEIPDGSKFCLYCGASLEGRSVKSKSSKKASKIIIPIIIIVVLLFGAFTYVKFIKPNIASTTKKETVATLIPYRKGDKWGFCDRNKKLVIPAIYDGTYLFPKVLQKLELTAKGVSWIKKGIW